MNRSPVTRAASSRRAVVVGWLLLAALATGGLLEAHSEPVDSGHGALSRELDVAARHPQAPLHLERSAVERERACAACEKDQRGCGAAPAAALTGACADGSEAVPPAPARRHPAPPSGTPPGRAPPRI